LYYNLSRINDVTYSYNSCCIVNKFTFKPGHDQISSYHSADFIRENGTVMLLNKIWFIPHPSSLMAQKVFSSIAFDVTRVRQLIWIQCGSQWPRCLRHELSSPARTLGSWVRIPLEAWMSVCVYSVFVLSFVQVAALRRADPPSKKSYRLCKRSWNWKSGQGPTKGCRATDRQTDGRTDGRTDGWMDGWMDGRTWIH
jgi:hypothetical protein